MTVDIRTAFLNTPWEDMDVLVRPPYSFEFIKIGFVPEGTFWRPTKALHGFRKSLTLLGNCKGYTTRRMEIPYEGKRHKLTQLVSEPNRWRIDEVKQEEDEEEDKDE